MEFCDINCFLNSKYFDLDTLTNMVELQEEYDNLLDSFKKSEDEKATAEATSENIIKEIEAIFSKYDDEFQSGNKLLDEVLIQLTKICEDNKI